MSTGTSSREVNEKVCYNFIKILTLKNHSVKRKRLEEGQFETPKNKKRRPKTKISLIDRYNFNLLLFLFMFRMRSIASEIRSQNWRLIDPQQMVPKFPLTSTHIHTPPSDIHSPAQCILWGWSSDITKHMQQKYIENFEPSMAPTENEIMLYLGTKTWMRAHNLKRYKYFWDDIYRPSYIPASLPPRDWFEIINARIAFDHHYALNAMHELWHTKLEIGSNLVIDEVKQRRMTDRAHFIVNNEKPVKKGHMIWSTCASLDDNSKNFIVVQLYVRDEKCKYTAQERVLKLGDFNGRNPQTHLTFDSNFDSEDTRNELMKRGIYFTTNHNSRQQKNFWHACQIDLAPTEVRALYKPKNLDGEEQIAYVSNTAYLSSYWTTYFTVANHKQPTMPENPVQQLYAALHGYNDH